MEMKNIIKALKEKSTEELTTLLKDGLGLDCDLKLSVDSSANSNVLIYFQSKPVLYAHETGAAVRCYLNFNDVSYYVKKPTLHFHPDTNHVSEQLDDVWQQCKELRDADRFDRAMKALFKFIVNKYRKPVSRGCVKAYVGYSKWFWVSKRATSERIAKLNDEYYMAENCHGFVKVNETQDTQRYLHTSDPVLNTEYRRLILDRYSSAEYYHNSLIVPVYETYNEESDSLGVVSRYELTWKVSQKYRSFTRPNGEVIYTVQQLAYASYYSTGVHGYSERIEKVLEPCDLFKFGSVDLYSRRDKDEVPFLGWELEACYGSRAKAKNSEVPTAFKKLLDKQIFCKSDSSISPAGFETVSIPATLDFWKESSLEAALNTMRSAPYSMRSWSHSSCGFHCHVSRSALSVLDLQKLERFMHNPANRAFLNDVAGRGPNTYQNYYTEEMFTERAKYSQTKKQRAYRKEDYISVDSVRTMRNSMGYWGCTTTDPYVLLLRLVWYYIGIASVGFRRPDYKRICKTFVVALNNDNSAYTLTDQLRAYEELTVEPLSQQEMINVFAELAVDPSLAIWTQNMFRAALEYTFPEVLNPPAAAEQNSIPEWKYKREKTTLPIGRKHNKLACTQSKGPTGKAITGRYDVLNTRNDKTVEFRLFKGTMNPDSVFRYLEFVDAMVRFVAFTSAQESGLSYVAFLDWLTKDSFNVMRYNHLVAFLVTKEYIERKRIRKRDLSVTVEDDTPNSKVETVPVPVVEASAAVVTLAELDEEAMPDVDPDPDYPDDDDYDEPCQCPSCQWGRGEMTDEEYNRHCEAGTEYDS